MYEIESIFLNHAVLHS